MVIGLWVYQCLGLGLSVWDPKTLNLQISDPGVRPISGSAALGLRQMRNMSYCRSLIIATIIGGPIFAAIIFLHLWPFFFFLACLL